MTQGNLFKGRDRRKRGWFWMDNDYLNGYAKIFGPIGTSIYVSLCRHADNDTQRCFPAMELMAEELGTNRKTISKYLKLFEKHKLISVEKERHPKTKKWLNNIYTLLDKESWISHGNVVVMDKSHGNLKTDPWESDAQTHGNVVPNKETHSNKTHIKETIAEASSASFSLEEKLGKMEQGENSYLDIIATFIREKPVLIENSKQLSAVISRYCRVAKKLAGAYTNKQIFATAEKIKNGDLKVDWTLETIYKQLTK